MRLLVVATLLLLVLPAVGAAQADSCVLDQPSSGSVSATEQNGFSVISVRGVVIRCAGGAEIRANEANIFQATRESHLYGDVVFQDAERRLTSNNAVYSSGTGWLHATGDVVFTDLASGSTLRGPDVEYFRVMPGRPQAQIIATRRPHLTLIPEGRDGNPGDPLEIDADRTTIAGDILSSVGSVVIQGTELNAAANEAVYNRATGRLDLRTNARIRGEEIDLTGQHIEAMMPGGGIESLVSRRDATLIGRELRVEAPELQLFFSDELLERLVARQTEAAVAAGTPAQPTITATGFRLEADSLEAISPGQRLQQVVAIGSARGEAIDTVPRPSAPATPAAGDAPADSVTAPTMAMDRDWILGDTVIGFFTAADTVSTPRPGADGAERDIRIERLVAKGSAKSLYRVRDEKPGASGPPALNYLSGETIELSFREGELDVAQVAGLQRGIYLEPTPTQPPGTPTEGATPAPAPGTPPPSRTP